MQTHVEPAAGEGGNRAPQISQLNAAYQYISDQIARGEVEPGAKLSRRKLAEEIGVSPALVQHALGQLEKAGLVECRARSGTYVRELTAEEFANLCDVRELVEPYAAARAASRISAPQLKVLETSCRRYDNLERRVPNASSALESWQIHHALIEEEKLFHGTILAAAENSILASLVQSLQLLGQVRHKFAMTSLSKDQLVASEHQQIVVALKARNPDLARRHMLDHLQNGRLVLEKRLRQRAPTNNQSQVNRRKSKAKVTTS